MKNIMEKEIPKWVSVIFVIMICLLCFLCILISSGNFFSGFNSESTPTKKTSETETITPTITLSPRASRTPTVTLTSTNTPIYTITLTSSNDITPTITNTQPIIALTVGEIELFRDQLTDIQWEKYIRDHIGDVIIFSGEISEVYDDRAVLDDDTEKKLFTHEYLFGIPYNTLISLQKGDYIKGYGIISDIDELFGLVIDINVTSFEIE